MKHAFIILCLALVACQSAEEKWTEYTRDTVQKTRAPMEKLLVAASTGDRATLEAMFVADVRELSSSGYDERYTNKVAAERLVTVFQTCHLAPAEAMFHVGAMSAVGLMNVLNKKLEEFSGKHGLTDRVLEMPEDGMVMVLTPTAKGKELFEACGFHDAFIRLVIAPHDGVWRIDGIEMPNIST